ncbi:hypothetical protein [Nocardiopsis tropica]|uniref:Uncharacterized protein n=1 Tax=Nocardiopsis tropica TaxID=109330 RepID=A0ABV2A554_9ACTN|nr:hypothetical protein [Nocardiopsis tropica]
MRRTFAALALSTVVLGASAAPAAAHDLGDLPHVAYAQQVVGAILFGGGDPGASGGLQFNRAEH